MESIKISLADAAQKLGDSVDYLLAKAEAEQLDVFARLQPFTAKLGMYPHKTDIYDNQTRSTATTKYTVLLPAQIAALRAGKQIEIKVVRPEGFENGYSIPSLSEELLLYWLDNPQQIGIESIFLNWRDESKQTDSISQEMPEGSMKPANNWDEHGLQRLLSESREAGMTHKILADRYGVSRQRIGMLLKNARPKKRNAFSGFADSNSKK